MKVAVTGGGGFLGREIARQLLQDGCEVVIVARGDYPKVVDWGALQVRGDLADPETALRAFQGCDAVVHCAAKAGIWGDPADFESSNVRATEHVIQACQALEISKLVFTSSPSVTFAGRDEINAPQNLPYPSSFLADYPRTKARAEQLVLEAHTPSLATTALRPHLIWGKHDPHLITRIVQRHLAGKLKIVGSGGNRVDMTHVKNAAYAHLLAVKHLSYDAPFAGKAYFISDDQPVEMWSWLNKLFHDAGLPPIKGRVPASLAYVGGAMAETIWRLFDRGGEPPMTRFVAKQLSTSHWYDMEPAKRDLGYERLVDPDVAYGELLDWVRNDLMPT